MRDGFENSKRTFTSTGLRIYTKSDKPLFKTEKEISSPRMDKHAISNTAKYQG